MTLASRQNTKQLWYSGVFLRLKGHRGIDANLTELRPLACARVQEKKMSLSRVSQCFNLSSSDFRLHKRAEGVPSIAARGGGGWLSSRPVRGGIFTLAPGTSRDDGDLLNEEVGEGGGGGGGNVAEGTEELRSGHALSSRGRGREKVCRKTMACCIHPSLHLDENVTQ